MIPMHNSDPVLTTRLDVVAKRVLLAQTSCYLSSIPSNPTNHPCIYTSILISDRIWPSDVLEKNFKFLLFLFLIQF